VALAVARIIFAVVELWSVYRKPAEPACAVVPSAIASAVFEATGARLRSVPFTPDKVLAELKRA